MLRVMVILSLLTTTLTVFAENKCVNLFTDLYSDSSSQSFIKPKLSSALLKKYGFQILPNGILVDKVNDVVLGVITQKQVSFLYRWASLDYQQERIKNGGITAEEVESTLAGKHKHSVVFVSTHPTNSHQYGTALLVFKTVGPILILDYSVLSKEDFSKFSKIYGHAVLKRLQGAGLDAIKSGHSTWLGMISNRHLKTETEIIDDPQLLKVVQNKDEYFLEKLKKSNLMHLIPLQPSTWLY